MLSPDVQLRAEANKIARWALVISIVSAFITSLSLIAPSISKLHRTREHEDGLVAGIAASNKQQFRSAMSHVQPESSAAIYLRNLSDWWSAAALAAGKPTLELDSGAVLDSTGLGASNRKIRVCLPKLIEGFPLCHTFSDFVTNAETGLITRFSIDDVAVDTLAWRGTISNNDALGDEDGLEIDARRWGTISAPDQSVQCTSYHLTVDSKDSKQGTTFFNRKSFPIEDRSQVKISGSFSWPAKLDFFESGWALVCVPPAGGFMLISQQKSKRDDSQTHGGWLDVS